MLHDATHIPAPYCLRCSFGLRYPDCKLRCADFLEETILGLGASTVSAFLGETISGATIAAALPPDGYWRKIREICDRHQVLMIQDEVMVGMGRTGKWFASQHYGVWPDLVTMGKGLSGGSLPLSAVGVKGEHYQAVAESTGFSHGGTYSHHMVTAAAGLKTVEILERENLVERSAEMGAVLGERLGERLTGHAHVADVRGLGMLWGVEFVQGKGSLKPYPRADKVTERLWQWLFEHGVIAYKSLGLAGVDGDALVIAPPFIISEDEIDQVVDTLGKAVDEVLGG